MDNLTSWTQFFFDSLKIIGDKIVAVLPSIFGALLFLLIGWFLARFISAAIVRVLQAVSFDSFAEKVKVKEFLSKANVNISASEIIGKFVRGIIILLAFVGACDQLGLGMVSEKIGELINYLPTLFVAIVIFLIGIYFATFIRDLIKGATASLGMSTGKVVSNLVFYFLFIMVTLTALDQAGIDTTVITSNMLIIMGSILAAAAISYGFASRDVLSNILAGYAGRNTFQKGQTIEIEGIKGEIIDITSTSVILQMGNQKMVIPNHDLLTGRVKVF